jgi:polar amino acid transport system substrate-binding protein
MRFLRRSVAALSTSLLLVSLQAGCASAPVRDIAPTGKLRVGIGVGLVPSAFWTVRDPATGQPRGVTVDLADAMARELGMPLELVAYNNSGDVTAGGPRGEWDVAFMPVDAERSKVVDFGPAIAATESSYLVPAGSAIRTMAEVDRPGVRVVGIEGTTTARSAARSLKNTPVKTFKTVDELFELVRTGQADAIALGRDSLRSFAAKFPGSRVLDGAYQSTVVAVAVPKGKPASLAYVSKFVEEAKARGTVSRALAAAGLPN